MIFKIYTAKKKGRCRRNIKYSIVSVLKRMGGRKVTVCVVGINVTS